MPVIRADEARKTSTPNGVMTTLASPSQGGAGQAMWRVDMPAGSVGPLHVFDTEQIWTLLSGGCAVDLGGEKTTAASGDTIVLPADVARQIFADTSDGFAAIVTAPAGSRAYNPGGVTAADACDIAPKDAERIVPPWIA
ncbi:cupin domain-containing protein [Microtetraspora malaysiensis]|uniref:cupin domain-containing protein n=1 Tax=Microtetraspora malaysiensis TaxID=161358 RepID=UPI003D89D01E